MPTVKMLPPALSRPQIDTVYVSDEGHVWAGGIGGVVYWSGEAWHPRIGGLTLTRTLALIQCGEWLIAGGLEGIARSRDGGLHWDRAALPSQTTIHTLLVLPQDHYGNAHTLFAASVESGILKSEDEGATWTDANFGIASLDITALASVGGAVYAVSSDGIYRSPNQGRAWKLVYEAVDPFTIHYLATADSALIAVENHLLDSYLVRSDDGFSWSRLEADQPQILMLFALTHNMLLAASGLYAAQDGGRSWQLIEHNPSFGALASVEKHERWTALCSDDGEITLSEDDFATWQILPIPPLHDLHRLIVVEGSIILAGRESLLMRCDPPYDRWITLDIEPRSTSYLGRYLTSIYVSTQWGLIRSFDHGDTWVMLRRGIDGWMSNLSFVPFSGAVYASTPDGKKLLRSPDRGYTWQETPSPFGGLPVITLQATESIIIAAVFDPRRQVINVWRSTDSGQRWFPGAEIPSMYPIAASWSDPAMIALPGAVLVSGADPTAAWERAQFDTPDVTIRTFAGDQTRLYALSLVSGVFMSEDRGAQWRKLALDLPENELMDIHAEAERLYVLMVGGRVAVIESEKTE